MKGQSGKSRYGWYDEFTAVLLDVCQQNKIKPTIGFDSSSDEAVGTLSKIAAAFERLLLPKMRSPASEAMVKRLQRSLRRLEQRVQTPSTRANPTRETSFEVNVADRTLFSKSYMIPDADKLAAAWGASAAA